MQRAAVTGLVAGAVIVIVLKLLTGMAFTPILIVFLLIFAIAGILRLRIDRMTKARL